MLKQKHSRNLKQNKIQLQNKSHRTRTIHATILMHPPQKCAVGWRVPTLTTDNSITTPDKTVRVTRRRQRKIDKLRRYNFLRIVTMPFHMASSSVEKAIRPHIHVPLNDGIV